MDPNFERLVWCGARRLAARGGVDPLASELEDYVQDLRAHVLQVDLGAVQECQVGDRERWACVVVRNRVASLARARRYRGVVISAGDTVDLHEGPLQDPLPRLEARDQLGRLRAVLKSGEWDLLMTWAAAAPGGGGVDRRKVRMVREKCRRVLARR